MNVRSAEFALLVGLTAAGAAGNIFASPPPLTMLIFRQLFDPQSSTYTYLLGDARTKEAVLIDSVFEHVSRDSALLVELGLRLVATLDTHIHADHVTGAWMMKQKFGSALMMPAGSGADCADRFLSHGDRIAFGSRHLHTRSTPGHTASCLTYVLDDDSMAFTGDCLLIRGSGRTDFQHGDSHAMFRSVHSQILTLPHACLLYPAHDYRGLTVTSVAEERNYNPRLGGEISEDDFTGFMSNLNLDHPKKMDIAVPANLRCGRPEKEMTEQDWAPLTHTFAGIAEIHPQTLEEIAMPVDIIDVREPDEYDGPLGHIRGAKLIPLGQLSQRTEEVARDRPVVMVCRSGARSAQATVLLQRAGFTKVANLNGGMLRWRAEGHPVETATR
jgi:glyoxylase-like metal-dependent hydrolase (beta-lactamase superfamily II)/rhodanese-related sulfurtransferase